MSEFAQGLRLKIPDRDAFEQYIKENAHDPGLHYDSWGDNSSPKAIYIVSYRYDDESPYYQCFNEYVNGVTNTHYYDEEILQEMINEGVVEEDGYDVDFVDSNL